MMKRTSQILGGQGAEPAALPERSRSLEDKGGQSTGHVPSGIRRRFSGRMRIASLALLALLTTSGLLYGQDGDALFIDSGGRVGIGISNPQEQLDVAGTVRAEGFSTPSGPLLAEIQAEVRKLHEAVTALNLQVPIGTMMAYGGDTADGKVIEALRQQGWLPCNGATLSRRDYSELFEAIGTAFGAGDAGTFQAPDLRGRFLRGVDQGTKRDPDSAGRRAEPSGGNSGNQVGSVQEDEFKSHTHGYNNFPDGRGPYPSGRYWNIVNRQTSATGGNETRPKNIYVNWIIKAKHPLPRPDSSKKAPGQGSAETPPPPQPPPQPISPPLAPPSLRLGN